MAPNARKSIKTEQNYMQRDAQLRRSTGSTLKHKVRNYMLISITIAPVTEKLKENILQWYGHVMMSPEDHMVNLYIYPPKSNNWSTLNHVDRC